jgi:peroxiredoxin
MREGHRLRTGIIDWLVGFAAFCAALAVVVRPQQDLRLFLLVAAAAYFAAGALRSGSVLLAGRALLLASGGIVPILLMRLSGIAFTAPFYVPLFLVAAIVGALAGGWFRGLLRQDKFAAASALATVTVAATALLVLVVAPNLMRGDSAQAVDRTAPDFVVTTLDGRTLRSHDLHGRVAVIAFWATWCVPCRGELPEVQRVYQRYQGDPRVAILAVDIADRDSSEQARAFLRKNGLSMPAAMDVTDSSAGVAKGSAAESLGQHGLPQIYVLDPRGHVRWVHSGYDASEQVADQLASAIASVLPTR